MTLTKKDKHGAALIAGVVAVVIGLFAVKLSLDAAPKPDKFDCLGQVAASTVIVIDRTEKVSQQTQNEILARTMAYIDAKVTLGERVTVFSLTAVSRQNLTPSFSRCKPERTGSRVVKDLKALEKNYKTKFLTPLEEALKAESIESKESPIAQALIDVSLTQYLRAPKNSLLVFSDMLEHVPTKFTMYPPQTCRDQQATVSAFRASKRGARERPSFTNTALFLNIIPRTDVPRSVLACRDQLWPWFFGDNEGGTAALTPDFLPGA